MRRRQHSRRYRPCSQSAPSEPSVPRMSTFHLIERHRRNTSFTVRRTLPWLHSGSQLVMGDSARGVEEALTAQPVASKDGLAYVVHTDDGLRLLLGWLVRSLTMQACCMMPLDFTSALITNCVVLCIVQRHHLPHSDKVFHTLRRALTPYRPHLHLSVYADSLSHDTLTTVIIVYGPANTRTAAAQQHGMPQPATIHRQSLAVDSPTLPPDAYNISFYTTRSSAAIAMLQHCVDFTRELEFAGVQRCHRTLVNDLQRWYEAQHTHERAELEYDPCNHWDYPFTVPPTSSGASPTNSVPARIARLPATTETAALIASHWPYSSPSTASLIRNLLLASEAPPPFNGSYGAYRGEELVAWEVKQPYGAIGKSQSPPHATNPRSHEHCIQWTELIADSFVLMRPLDVQGCCT